METEKMEKLKTPNLLNEETNKEKSLRTLEKESSSELSGSNKIFFVKLKGDGSGVFKPEFGELPSFREWAGGALYKRERAAYLVDRFLDLGLVPPTVIKEVDGKIGSFQEFINDAKTGYEVEKDKYVPEMTKLWVFDFIIWNSDRNSRNFLFDKDEKKLHAIDNGIAFCKSRFRPSETFYDQPIPEECREKIKNLSSSEDKKSILKDLLEELLPKEEVEACFNRIELLNTKGVITHEDVEKLEEEYQQQKRKYEKI